VSATLRHGVKCESGNMTRILYPPVAVQGARQSEEYPPAGFHVQMMSTVSGRERSQREFEKLLQAAGFQLEGVWRARGLVSLLAAKPAT
jgi:hypothetical protein